MHTTSHSSVLDVWQLAFTLALCGAASRQRTAVTCWLQIVPVENIQGRKAVEQGNLCLRKTSGGVDLNRNWPVAWQQEVCSDRAARHSAHPLCPKWRP